MRVGDSKNRDLKAAGQAISKREVSDKRVDFHKTLDAHQERERSTNLNKLIERVNDTGTALVRSRNLSDLKRFKNAVADFLAEANQRTFQLKEENSWDYMGNRKHHIIVQKIDEKMEELTKEIIDKQEDNLRILELVDEIKGIIFDQYM